MRKIIRAARLLIFLIFFIASVNLSAQFYYDDDFVNIGRNQGSAEAMAGFSMNWHREGSSAFVERPSFALAYRHFFMGSSGIGEMGISVISSFTFLGDMSWTVPLGSAVVTHNAIYTPGSTVRITSSDAAYIINGSALFGISYKMNMLPGFNAVFDVGFAVSVDTANWRSRFFVTEVHPIWGWGGPGYITTTTAIVSTVKLNTVNFGIGANAGLQYSFGSMFIEAGVNFAYHFWRYSSYETGWYRASTPNVINNQNDGAGAFRMARLFKMGAPYIMVGFRF